jgi:hypothetical protein
MRKPDLYDAATALAGENTVKFTTRNNIEFFPEVENPPSQSAIDTKLAELISDWDAQEYARNRQAEYPDWGTQLNKIYDDGLTKWKSEMVDPIKAKWPKDNSGPV